MRVRFWGTRGSIARPGPTTLRYGGNTACVEVRAADGTLVVLDCGTGAYALGRELAHARSGPVRGHLLIGHTHWDHIQGFPFFEPLFAPEHGGIVYAPGRSGRQLEETLAGQMSLPVLAHQSRRAARAGPTSRISPRAASSSAASGSKAQYLNHPALTLGYRLEADGAARGLRDGSRAPLAAPHGAARLPGRARSTHEDRSPRAFLAGADLVIHDAQYTLAEFPEQARAGDTRPVERAVDYASPRASEAPRAVPPRSGARDELVDGVLEGCAQARRRSRLELEVFAAAEGQGIELSGDGGPRSESRSRSDPRCSPRSGGATPS